jgi:hypothetical protein
VDYTQYAKRCATVREAVEDVARRTGRPKYEVAYELMLKVKRGELAVESGADNALAYVLGPGGAWLWLVLGLTAAASTLALYATEPPTPLPQIRRRHLIRPLPPRLRPHRGAVPQRRRAHTAGTPRPLHTA